MKHRIETVNAFQLIGFHISEYNMDVLYTWKVLRSKANELERLANLTVSYSVSQNQGTGEFTYFAGFPMVPGVPAHQLPIGFRYLLVDPQKYAIFTYQGNAAEIEHAKKQIWSKWIPELQLIPLNSLEGNRYATVIERFDNRFIGQGDSHSEMEIWIPVV